MSGMLNHLKKYKRILAVIAIVLITAAVELIANIHALRGGYDSLDLSEKIEVTGGGRKRKVSGAVSVGKRNLCPSDFLDRKFPGKCGVQDSDERDQRIWEKRNRSLQRFGGILFFRIQYEYRKKDLFYKNNNDQKRRYGTFRGIAF